MGEGEGHLRRNDEDRDSWEKSAQGMGAAEGASSTREWARREARCVRAGHRDSPGASREEARRVWAQGQSRREQGRGAPRGRLGQSRRELRDSCGLRYRRSSGTVPARAGQRRAVWEAGTVPARAQGQLSTSDIGNAQGQLTWTPNGSIR